MLLNDNVWKQAVELFLDHRVAFAHTRLQTGPIHHGDVAVTLVKLMGYSGTVPSALLTEDEPAALARLKAAVAEHSNEPLDPLLTN